MLAYETFTLLMMTELQKLILKNNDCLKLFQEK